MAKKQKEEKAVDIFAVLAQDEGQDEENSGAEGGAGTPDPALSGKIGALEEKLAALERTNRALMQNQGTFYPSPQVGKQGDEVPEVDYSGLPDPVTDSEAYHKEFSKRLAAQLKAQFERDQAARDAQRDAQAAQENQVNTLWAEFEEKYPELAAHRELVEVAAVSVANKARAKGLDVKRYMFTASDQYIEDVASEIKKKYGKAIEVLNKGEEEEESVNDGEPQGSTMSEALVAARTRGIQGGIPTSGKGGKADQGSQARDDLVSDLQKVQRAMGIV